MQFAVTNCSRPGRVSREHHPTINFTYVNVRKQVRARNGGVKRKHARDPLRDTCVRASLSKRSGILMRSEHNSRCFGTVGFVVLLLARGSSSSSSSSCFGSLLANIIDHHSPYHTRHRDSALAVVTYLRSRTFAQRPTGQDQISRQRDNCPS